MQNLYAGQEATVRTEYKQWTDSKLAKEYVKTVYCHSVYLTFMQSTPCRMPSWMTHKLESRLPGEISTTLRLADDTTTENEEELESLLIG